MLTVEKKASRKILDSSEKWKALKSHKLFKDFAEKASLEKSFFKNQKLFWMKLYHRNKAFKAFWFENELKTKQISNFEWNRVIEKKLSKLFDLKLNKKKAFSKPNQRFSFNFQ